MRKEWNTLSVRQKHVISTGQQSWIPNTFTKSESKIGVYVKMDLRDKEYKDVNWIHIV
jgi:hypothetical protein